MYKLKIQLRDTVIECSSKSHMDDQYSKILEAVKKLEIPPDNIILSKIETAKFDFDGLEHEKITETNIE
jgi:hypothetical protein